MHNPDRVGTGEVDGSLFRERINKVERLKIQLEEAPVDESPLPPGVPPSGSLAMVEAEEVILMVTANHKAVEHAEATKDTNRIRSGQHVAGDDVTINTKRLDLREGSFESGEVAVDISEDSQAVVHDRFCGTRF